ncbi:hypothetical protein [Paenibacillus taichungensis]
MWGVAIGFIIIGAAQYRFRKKLKLPTHQEVESIGRTFWRVGWGMLIWWITASILGVQEPYKIIIASFGTIWLCIRGIQLANRLMNPKNYSAGNVDTLERTSK